MYVQIILKSVKVATFLERADSVNRMLSMLYMYMSIRGFGSSGSGFGSDFTGSLVIAYSLFHFFSPATKLLASLCGFLPGHRNNRMHFFSWQVYFIFGLYQHLIFYF